LSPDQTLERKVGEESGGRNYISFSSKKEKKIFCGGEIKGEQKK